MAPIPYALSIQHFINTVGAKAGFAAIIGLALLVLLFFTQSRETANLRRRADEAEQQLQQLQLHVDHLSRQRAQPAPAPAAAQATQTTGAPVAAPPAAAALSRPMPTRALAGEQVAGGGGVATLPVAPAGVGAPALSSATRLIPLAEPDEISIRALRPSTNGGGGPHEPDATVAAPPPGPAPSTAAGGNGTNGVARPPAPVPMPTMGGPAAAPAPAPRVALPRQNRPSGRPPASGPRRPARDQVSARPGHRLSPLLIALGAVLAVAIAVGAVILLTGSSANTNASRSASAGTASASSTSAAGTTKSGKRHKATAAATVAPSAVTVAVLNGTSTNHLAADVLAKLTAAGYHGSTTQNASESGVTSTIVGYTQPTYRNDALAVAKSLNLGSASVQSVSQGDRSKVCGTAASCPEQVVVTAGNDLSQTG